VASTDIEHSFSCGGLTVSKMCHSLVDRSVHAATLVGSWVAFPGLIPQEKLIQTFNDKGKWPKGKAPVLGDEQEEDMVTEIVLI
jgi:hypothetical protein